MNLPTLLHSVSYSGSWGQAQLSVEDFINRAADFGYSGVMLMAKRPQVSVLDYDEATGPACAARSKSADSPKSAWPGTTISPRISSTARCRPAKSRSTT